MQTKMSQRRFQTRAPCAACTVLKQGRNSSRSSPAAQLSGVSNRQPCACKVQRVGNQRGCGSRERPALHRRHARRKSFMVPWPRQPHNPSQVAQEGISDHEFSHKSYPHIDLDQNNGQNGVGLEHAATLRENGCVLDPVCDSMCLKCTLCLTLTLETPCWKVFALRLGRDASSVIEPSA